MSARSKLASIAWPSSNNRSSANSFKFSAETRRHLEAASSLGQDQTLRGEAAQNLAQRADADAVALLEPVELELLSRPQPAKNDVGADTPIAIVADGFALFGPLDQGHVDPMQKALDFYFTC
jgi:hypothetical protein